MPARGDWLVHRQAAAACLPVVLFHGNMSEIMCKAYLEKVVLVSVLHSGELCMCSFQGSYAVSMAGTAGLQLLDQALPCA